MENLESYKALIEELSAKCEKAKVEMITAEANIKQYESQKNEILNYCKENNIDIDTIDEQVDTLQKELQSLLDQTQKMFKDAGYSM